MARDTEAVTKSERRRKAQGSVTFVAGGYEHGGFLGNSTRKTARDGGEYHRRQKGFQ